MEQRGEIWTRTSEKRYDSGMPYAKTVKRLRSWTGIAQEELAPLEGDEDRGREVGDGRDEPAS